MTSGPFRVVHVLGSQDAFGLLILWRLSRPVRARRRDVSWADTRQHSSQNDERKGVPHPLERPRLVRASRPHKFAAVRSQKGFALCMTRGQTDAPIASILRNRWRASRRPAYRRRFAALTRANRFRVPAPIGASDNAQKRVLDA